MKERRRAGRGVREAAPKCGDWGDLELAPRLGG